MRRASVATYYQQRSLYLSSASLELDLVVRATNATLRPERY